MTVQPDEGRSSALDRRHLLALGAGLPFSILLSGAPSRASAADAVALDRSGAPAGLRAYRHAMHLHGSDSEGSASWSEHLRLAASVGIDYVWPSDHGWRLDATNSRFVTGYDFRDGLASGPFAWRRSPSDPAEGSVDIVALTGRDGSFGEKALQLRTTGARGTQGVTLDDKGGAFAGNVRGRSISGHVWITSGAMVVAVRCSRHHIRGRSGRLSIRYVFGDVKRADIKESAFAYEVRVPTAPMSWSRFSVAPQDDIARLWPELDSEDNVLRDISIAAMATESAAEIRLPRLELPRETTGGAAVRAHDAMLARVAAAEPKVLLGNALEYSWDGSSMHASGFFPDRSAPLLPASHPYAHLPSYPAEVAKAVHALGGICSLNHPTGTSLSVGSSREQSARALSSARDIIKHAIYGVDVIEIGYRQRGGLSIDSYLLQLAALVWRDGWFFTASGVSDDHTASGLQPFKNPGVTHIWAKGPGLGDQTAALAMGRVHVAMHDLFAGTLWLGMNGAPMGSVQVNPGSGANVLSLSATEMASRWKATIYRGVVDYPGTAVRDPGLTAVRTFSGSDLAAGPVEVRVDRPGSAYYLAVLRTSDDMIAGFTNPVWDLKGVSTSRPVPDGRRVL